MFLGYLNSPTDTASRFDPDGFFKTGDLAIRKNGRYIFQGRQNMDMFKFYTYKVPRLHVEAHLLALPYIAEGYILPVEDPQCDTRVAALVRFHPHHIGDLQALRKALAEQLPAYQLPTLLRVLREGEAVPRTWSDKVALGRAVGMFFGEGGKGVEVGDVGGFMKGGTERMWDLSGMRG
ncbi:MAG: hypothetical protein Q9195_002791 [Heterodermia aff. obscurata]